MAGGLRLQLGRVSPLEPAVARPPAPCLRLAAGRTGRPLRNGGRGTAPGPLAGPGPLHRDHARPLPRAGGRLFPPPCPAPPGPRGTDQGTEAPGDAAPPPSHVHELRLVLR